jgi:hypothetical protein
MPMAQRPLRPPLIIVLVPALDEDPGFPGRAEDLPVAQVFPHFAIAALVVAILPWTARFESPGRADWWILERADALPQNAGSQGRQIWTDWT